MKIWCDVCDKEEAIVFCSADEAALCEGCDLPIHKTNEHTQKHNRFLLTGIKLSSSSSSSHALNPTSSSSNGATIDTETKSTSQSSKRFRSVSINETFSSPSIDKPLPTTAYRVEDNYASDTASISTSSISEYLMEALPGRRVDDFLEPSCSANGFCKTSEQVSQ